MTSPPTSELMSAAAIMLADRIVRKLWHNGFPHSSTCRAKDCAFPRYQGFRASHGHYIAALITWRRQIIFGRDWRRNQFSYPYHAADDEFAGELWEIWQPQLVFGTLRRLGDSIGVPSHDVISHMRTYTAGVLAVIADCGGPAPYPH